MLEKLNATSIPPKGLLCTNANSFLLWFLPPFDHSFVSYEELISVDIRLGSGSPVLISRSVIIFIRFYVTGFLGSCPVSISKSLSEIELRPRC